MAHAALGFPRRQREAVSRTHTLQTWRTSYLGSKREVALAELKLSVS
jgi:hypothetical protein